MAIDKSAPDIWTPERINHTADLVGQEFIHIYQNNYWKFYKRSRPSIPEEWLIEHAIMRVQFKIRLPIPEDIYTTIYDHPILDRYLDELEEEVERERPSLPRFGEVQVYVSPSQQLDSVGMRQSDFI